MAHCGANQGADRLDLVCTLDQHANRSELSDRGRHLRVGWLHRFELSRPGVEIMWPYQVGREMRRPFGRDAVMTHQLIMRWKTNPHSAPANLGTKPARE